LSEGVRLRQQLEGERKMKRMKNPFSIFRKLLEKNPKERLMAQEWLKHVWTFQN